MIVAEVLERFHQGIVLALTPRKRLQQLLPTYNHYIYISPFPSFKKDNISQRGRAKGYSDGRSELGEVSDRREESFNEGFA